MRIFCPDELRGLKQRHVVFLRVRAGDHTYRKNCGIKSKLTSHVDAISSIGPVLV
jgi:hypothetical protein